MNLPPVILASASPRRAELLRGLVPEFGIVVSDAPEVEHEFLTPHEICQLNAYRKAHVVAKQHPDALVIGADTLVFLGTQLFAKPANLAEAETMLARLAGRTHEVITGVCLVQQRAHRQRLFATTTAVTFRELSRTEIRDYLGRINPLDKAGGYAIQEHGSMIVEAVRGSYSNVVGLPTEQLRGELQHWMR